MVERHTAETLHEEEPSHTKPSGIFPRGGEPTLGWGFVLPRDNGQFEIVSAANGSVVGSGAEAETHLEGPEVAPQHARIEVRADGVYLEDLGTTGGTFVGGVRAARIGVTHGDVVRFGSQLAVFVERGLAQYEGRIDPDKPLFASPHDHATWIAPALAHLSAGRSFSIEGGPGLGKRTLAKVLAKDRESAGAVVVLEPSDIRPESIPQARAQKPATWIVVQAERVPRPMQSELAQAISRTPGAILIATFETRLDRALADGLVAPVFATLLNARRITVPPLTARRESIPGIVRHIAKRLNIPESRLTVDLMEAITRAGWPRGIVEIEEVLREAAASGEGPLHADAISRTLTRPPSVPPSPPAADDPGLARARLTDALAKANGAIASAARTLGMSRQAVYREAQRLGIEVGKRRAR